MQEKITKKEVNFTKPYLLIKSITSQFHTYRHFINRNTGSRNRELYIGTCPVCKGNGKLPHQCGSPCPAFRSDMTLCDDHDTCWMCEGKKEITVKKFTKRIQKLLGDYALNTVQYPYV